MEMLNPETPAVAWTRDDEAALLELDQKIVALQIELNEMQRKSSSLRDLKRRYVLLKKEALVKLIDGAGLTSSHRDQIVGHLMRNSDAVVNVLRDLPQRSSSSPTAEATRDVRCQAPCAESR